VRPSVPAARAILLPASISGRSGRCSATFAEMAARLRVGAPSTAAALDLVEVAAGNGRLARDLSTPGAAASEVYRSAALHLVERSETARRSSWRRRRMPAACAASSPDPPDSIHGIVFANELLDAFPPSTLSR
jgi:SAM-dependent MidA family methyltransferase